MRINNNMMAMNTHRQLGVANQGGAKSMEKLSSGLRINRAGDDAAGLAISEKMRGQIRGLNQASSNAQDGISLIQTAEGALNETHAILQRMRELAVQSSTDTNTDADRLEIQKEVNQLSAEITRIADTTQFNTMNLLDGKYEGKKFHIGANSDQNTTINISDMKAKALGVEGEAYKKAVGDILEVTSQGNVKSIEIKQGDATSANSLKLENVEGAVTITLASAAGDATGTSTLGEIKAALEREGLIVDYVGTKGATDVQTAAVASVDIDGAVTDTDVLKQFGIDVFDQGKANDAIETINSALETVSGERSKLGAMQNRLEHTIKNLDTSAENLQASEARIRDVDMAKEMMEQTRNNILQQASTAMLAQANQAPQQVLQLLR